jgi:ABC-2 type transport system ATP-binding protein
MTLLLTSHYLEEAQALADRIVIIAGGRIVAEGTPDDIGGRGTAPGILSFMLPPGRTVAQFPALPADVRIDEHEGHVRIASHDLVGTTHAITGWALEEGIDLAGFRAERPTLEDTYLAIIGEVPPAAEVPLVADRAP